MIYYKVLEFWFPNDEFNKFWFNKDEKIDNFIFNNFKNYLDNITQENTITYENSDELLAKIITLDQFTRNIFRNSKKAYLNDSKALNLAKEFFKCNFNKNMNFNKIVFALMPFRHSENIKDQEFVIEYLNKNKKDTELFNKFFKASIRSYNTIKKYGYFPNRVIYLN